MAVARPPFGVVAMETESMPTKVADPDLDVIFNDGFEYDIFLADDRGIEERMVCRLCMKVARDPRQRICGHVFCRVCLDKLVRKAVNNPESVYCPACILLEDVIDESRLRTVEYTSFDYAMIRILNNKVVRCPQPGCTYQGALKLYEMGHELTCEHAFFQCPNKCEQRIHVSEIVEHQKTKCPMRTVVCEHCGVNYPFCEEQDHLRVCPSRPAICDLCGRKDFTREQLEKHQDTECKFFKCPLGCPKPISRQDVQNHFTDPKYLKQHMTLIGQKLDSLSLDVKNVSTVASLAKPASLAAGATTVDDDKVMELLEAVTSLDDQVMALDNMNSVYKVEFEKLIESSMFIKQRVDALHSTQSDMQERLQRLEQTVQIRDVQLMERDLRLKALEEISYDGTLVWRVDNFSECRRKARDGEMTSIYSPAFYTSRCGYKLCARLYLNGDGIGKGTHISFFFVVMRGKYDGLLRWPFQQKVTMMLLDYSQQHHIMDAFRPDSGSASFHKPKNEMNVASGCPLFMPLSALNEKITNHVRDDVAYFKIIVDCSDIPY